MLVGYLRDCTLRITYFGMRVLSLHAAGELLDEASSWGVFCVLGVKPFVSCGGYKRGRGHCTRCEIYAYFVGV